jgi:hypothetical protein
MGLDEVPLARSVADFLSLQALPKCDAVWTSCSWHYSANHARPLGDFTSKMQDVCAPGGLLGAEFMMPVEERHHAIEHYLDEGEIRRYFRGWDFLWEAYTPPFTEEPHVEQLQPHTHRMGIAISERKGTKQPR